MADVPFIIPQKLEDLCAYSNERYVVATDYAASEVNDKISGKGETAATGFVLTMIPLLQDSRPTCPMMDLHSFWTISTSCTV